MKIAVILSGSGVYDGSEIHESVLSLLALEENSVSYQCYAPNINQHHVVNHINGEEMDETRNCLVEAARIARGNILDLKELSANDADGLMIPGGFGAAKNLTTWAFSGPDSEINEDVKSAILSFTDAKKPICALCMGPTVVAKALQGSTIQAELSVGTTEEKSPYDIGAIGAGMEATGATNHLSSVKEIHVDEANKIISAPCYMMEASLLEVRENIKMAVEALVKLC